MYNILVTGVGAVIGYGVVQSLKISKYDVKVIGIDIYEDAIGQEWCDVFEQGIPASSPEFPHFLKGIIEKYNIDLVIPAIEQDIDRIVNDYDYFKEINTKYVLNNFELINIANDKWLTHLKLIECNIPAIKTHIDGEYDILKEIIGNKMLLKPRKSYASKGIFEILNNEEFNFWKKKLGSQFMVQQIVGELNSEFTVAVFGYGEGKCSNPICLKRKLGPDGATAKASVFQDEKLEKKVKQIVSYFNPIGPTNLQFRFHDGEYLLLEINPRISSSTSIRTAFNYNEAEMCIDYYLNNRLPNSIDIKLGKAIRFLKDMIYYDSCDF